MTKEKVYQTIVNFNPQTGEYGLLKYRSLISTDYTVHSPQLLLGRSNMSKGKFVNYPHKTTSIINNSPEKVEERSIKIEFSGIDSVRLAFGTIETCKFTTSGITSNGISWVTEDWFAIQSGYKVKSVERTSNNTVASTLLLSIEPSSF